MATELQLRAGPGRSIISQVYVVLCFSCVGLAWLWPSAVFAFGPRAHCCLSDPPLRALGFDLCQRGKICDANAETDDCNRPYRPCEHFDRVFESADASEFPFRDGLKCLHETEAAIATALKPGGAGCDEALALMGHAMHAVQDLALHSNLCDLPDADQPLAFDILSGNIAHDDFQGLYGDFKLRCWTHDPAAAECGSGCAGDSYPHTLISTFAWAHLGTNLCMNHYAERLTEIWLDRLKAQLDNQGLWGKLMGSGCGQCQTRLGKAVANLPGPTCGFPYKYEIRTSWDPNDKSGPIGVGDRRYIRSRATPSYNIEFENLPEATLPALRVLVVDSLVSSGLDISSVRFQSIRIGTLTAPIPGGSGSFVKNVDLRPANQVGVRVTGWTDTAARTVFALFETVDPSTGIPLDDPERGFLPPNATPPAGEGAVGFEVAVDTSTSGAGAVTNTASVYFDGNRPVQTPVWVNTIDDLAPNSRVAPLPAMAPSARIPVTWEALDGGAGVEQFDVFVAKDNGPFVLWRPGTTLGGETYVATAAGRYGFYVVATDSVGNRESKLPSEEAFTTVDEATGTNETMDLIRAWSGSDSIVIDWRVNRKLFGSLGVEKNAGSEWSATLGLVEHPSEALARYTERGVGRGCHLGYRLVALAGGVRTLSGEVWIDTQPGYVLRLRGFVESPSRDGMVVLYELPRDGDAKLEIFDVAGRRVRAFELRGARAGVGIHRDDAAGRLGAGVYWLCLSQGGGRVRARGVVLP